MKAMEIANNLFETNTYQDMKAAENEEKAIKEELKSRMGDERRIVKSGIVMKFIKQNTYMTDNQKLNSFLNDFGIIHETVKISPKNLDEITLSQITPFKNPSEHYVKLNVRLKKEIFDLKKVSTSDLIKRWVMVNKSFKILSDEYKQKREEMNNCSTLVSLDKPLPFKHGSISRVKLEQTYDIEAIQAVYGNEFLINHGTPVMDKIEKYINKGYFTPSEVDKFKTLISGGTKFLVMTIKAENDLMNFLGQTKSRASIKGDKIRNQQVV